MPPKSPLPPRHGLQAAWVRTPDRGREDPNWLTLRDFPYTNPNDAALEYARVHQPALYDAYINSPITNTPAEALANGHHLQDVGAALVDYDRIWTEVKAK